MVRYIKYKDIDTEAWDKCIKASVNKDVTALSGYLDISCKKWDALVSDDYKAVMPLPKLNNRIFNNYYTNFLVPQLGVYGNKIDSKLFTDFINIYKNKAHNVNYKLNKFNFFKENKFNFDIKQAYEFDVYTKDNILLDKKYQINLKVSNNEVIKFIESENIISSINKVEFNVDLFRQILAYTIRNRIAYTYIALDDYNTMIGFAFFIKSFSKDKLIYAAVREKLVIKNVFEFMLNNHINRCRRNISIDLGYSDTYFDNVYRSFDVKQYNIYSINKI